MSAVEVKESLGRRTARVMSAVMLGQIANIVITGVTIILVARLLGPVDYGIYVFAFGFASLIDAVGGFGIGTYFNRHLAIHSYSRDTRRMSRTLSSGYVLLALSSVAITILALLLSGYVSNTLYKSLDIPYITLITSSLMILFVMLQAVSVQALIGLSRGIYSSISGIVGNSIQLAGSVGLIMLGFGVEGALIGMLLGYAASALLATLLVFRSMGQYGGFTFTRPMLWELKETAKFSFPIGFNTMLNDGMQNFSILFLGFYVSKAILGNYGAALKGLSAVILLHNSINNALLPAFSTAKLVKKPQSLHKTYNKVLGYSLILTLPLLVYLAVFSEPAIYLFLSKSYSTAPTYLSLILIGAIVNTVSLFISGLIVSRGKTGLVLKYNAIAAVSGLILLLLLTPRFAVYGNIVAIFLVSNAISIILMIRGAIRTFGVRFDYMKILAIFGSNILFGAVLYALLYLANASVVNPLSDPVMAAELILGALAAAALYPVILARTHVMTISDIKSLTAAVGHLPMLSAPTTLALRYTKLFIPDVNGSKAN